MYEEMMGTKPVSERQRFDVEALGAWLEAHVDGYPGGSLAVEQFKGGQSNPTFKLITPGRTYVMRAKPGPKSKVTKAVPPIRLTSHVVGTSAMTEVAAVADEVTRSRIAANPPAARNPDAAMIAEMTANRGKNAALLNVATTGATTPARMPVQPSLGKHPRNRQAVKVINLAIREAATAPKSPVAPLTALAAAEVESVVNAAEMARNPAENRAAAASAGLKKAVRRPFSAQGSICLTSP
jgi:hypothetical protein